ncbi:MAG: zinc-binding dehydrogenase [Gammaproteobacteria bacterium]|jgi:NADPH:quinone reductase-like Zn-dependent oxidoreductase|nr:zinc-binding dehydrogenase [Gammaproteobacteria bacterium]
MKKVVIHKPGGYEQLKIEEHADLHPGPDEVLIDVSAIGVNFADCITRMGLYASAKEYVGYPITPGFEVSGTIRSVGAGVMAFSPGSAVLAVTRFDGYATQLVVKQSQVFPLPAQLSHEVAASLPAVSLTAWFALFQLAHAQSTDTILVHSAAGGVGSMLVQLGKIAGCKVIGVVGAAHKTATVMSLGADAVIDKSTQDLWTEAERLAPDGYDIILDANGAATLKQSYQHLATVGKLVVYGFHSMLQTRKGVPGKLRLVFDYLRTPRFSPFDLTTQNHSVMGFNLSFLFDKNAIMQQGMQQILQWLETGRLQVPAVTSYPLEAVADAHRALESGQTTGKLVLLCAP